MSGLYGGSKEFAGAAAGAAPEGSTANNSSAPSTTKIDLHAVPDPLKAGGDNKFQVSLADANGNAIADAKVTVTLVMPAMPSMGMPEMKSYFDLLWTATRKKYVAKDRRRWRAPGPSWSRHARTTA